MPLTSTVKRFLSNRIPLWYQGKSTNLHTLYMSVDDKYPGPSSLPNSRPASTVFPEQTTSNPEPQGPNISRGDRSRYGDAPPSGNYPSPVSAREGRHLQAQEGEEQTGADAQIKNDPRMTGERKRERVKKAGERPLGAEDYER